MHNPVAYATRRADRPATFYVAGFVMRGAVLYNNAMSENQMRLTSVPADTTPEAAWVQMQIFRNMSPERRFRLTLEMNDTARAISAAGVRHRHPDFTEEQVRLTVIRLCIGDSLFRKAFPGAI